MHGRLDAAAAEQMNTQTLIDDIEQIIWRDTVWLQSNATDMQRDITRMQQQIWIMEHIGGYEKIPKITQKV